MLADDTAGILGMKEGALGAPVAGALEKVLADVLLLLLLLEGRRGLNQLSLGPVLEVELECLLNKRLKVEAVLEARVEERVHGLPLCGFSIAVSKGKFNL